LGHRPFQRKCRHQCGIWAEEEVADRETPLSQMAGPVVQHVAPLTEGTQIVQSIVGRITVEMRSGENNARHSERGCFHQIRPLGCSPAAIAPGRCPLVEPASVRQTPHQGKVRTGTALTPPSSALEADPAAQFTPVWWVEGTQLRTDRHGYITSPLPGT
jgi:hypothetical protein